MARGPTFTEYSQNQPEQTPWSFQSGEQSSVDAREAQSHASRGPAFQQWNQLSQKAPGKPIGEHAQLSSYGESFAAYQGVRSPQAKGPSLYPSVPSQSTDNPNMNVYGVGALHQMSEFNEMNQKPTRNMNVNPEMTGPPLEAYGAQYGVQPIGRMPVPMGSQSMPRFDAAMPARTRNSGQEMNQFGASSNVSRKPPSSNRYQVPSFGSMSPPSMKPHKAPSQSHGEKTSNTATSLNPIYMNMSTAPEINQNHEKSMLQSVQAMQSQIQQGLTNECHPDQRDHKSMLPKLRSQRHDPEAERAFSEKLDYLEKVLTEQSKRIDEMLKLRDRN